MLGKISQAEKYKYCIISLYEKSKINTNGHIQQKRNGFTDKEDKLMVTNKTFEAGKGEIVLWD